MKKYIIDNEIVFSPQEKQLLSLKNSLRFTIHSTSASCLLLLLERQGEVVTQAELLVAGWGADAMKTVSNAAYYQCFVNLRKVFRALGYQKEFLTTVRGQGIRFNRYIRVKKQEQSAILQRRQQKIVPPLPAPADEQPPSHELAAAGQAPLVERVPESSAATKNSIHLSSAYKKLLIPRVSLSLLLLCLLLAIVTWLVGDPKDSFTIPGYHHLSNAPDCMYFNDRNSDNDFVLDFLHSTGFTCNGDKKYFVSYFATSPRLTVFICGTAAAFKCKSLTYILDKNE